MMGKIILGINFLNHSVDRHSNLKLFLKKKKQGKKKQRKRKKYVGNFRNNKTILLVSSPSVE